MKQHQGFPQSEELVSPFLFKYYLIPWFPIPFLIQVSEEQSRARVLGTGDQRLPAVSFAYCLVDIISCTLFWRNLLNLLNATFIYSWRFTPESDYQAGSLFLFKHLITYTPLCWRHPSCTIYRCSPHICAHTHRHTRAHAPLHMLVTFATYTFLFALHIHVELFHKNQNKVLFLPNIRVTRKREEQWVGTRCATFSQEATAVPGHWARLWLAPWALPWASHPSEHSLWGKGGGRELPVG